MTDQKNIAWCQERDAERARKKASAYELMLRRDRASMAFRTFHDREVWIHGKLVAFRNHGRNG